MGKTKEKTREYNQRYYAKKREALVQYARDYRASNGEEVRAVSRERYAANPSKKKAQSSASGKRCNERRRAYNKQWRKDNPEKAAATRSKYMAERSKLPHIALRNRISCGIYDCLKRGKNHRASEAIVGWTMEELRIHLERQFVDGMSWDNMGRWHIDHIVPLASFTITGPDDPELRRAWALTNLRPLWSVKNIAKGARREFLL